MNDLKYVVNDLWGDFDLPFVDLKDPFYLVHIDNEGFYNLESIKIPYILNQ